MCVCVAVCVKRNQPQIVSCSLLVFFHYEFRGALGTYLGVAFLVKTVESGEIAYNLVVAGAPKTQTITLHIFSIAHVAVVAYLLQIVA